MRGFRVWGMVAALGVPAAAAQDFPACLDGLRQEASAGGISDATVASAFEGIEPDESVIVAMDSQPEFRTPVWEYLANLVDARRIATGRAKLREWAGTLARVERELGVDRHMVVAVWGVETDYGRITGRRPLLRSLATVSCFGRRQRYFRGELLATLRLIENGDIPAEQLKGSWAGAFGLPQFMPSTFHRAAVDFDGDGRRDIVASVPDALASIANYLRLAGWRSGDPWGYEVRVPRGYDGPSGRRDRRPLGQWRALGIRRLDGKPPKGEADAALLLPAGLAGPAFLVFRNFDAIYSYNAAESYALAIAHLADRLHGRGPFQARWPLEDPGLSDAERRELQERLRARGFDAGGIDGIIGPRTRGAIKAFQRAAGLPSDGYAGRRLLSALRK